MSNLHIYAPKVTGRSFRVLPKGCRLFIDKEFKTWGSALRCGLKRFGGNFRIFDQRCYEYHEPLNTEIVKIGDLGGMKYGR